MTANITVHQSGALAEIVWAEPKLNLFTAKTADEIDRCLDQLAPDTRAVLISGRGRAFCAGVDVHEFADMNAQAGAAFSERLLALVHRIEDLPFPTVISVHALNLTIGLELALACDFIFAASDSAMGLVEPKVGLTPAAGGVQRLVARIGLTKATRMVLLGSVVDAPVLAEWGLVDSIHPKSELHSAASEFASSLADGPTRAYDAAKRILHSAAYSGVEIADGRTSAIAGPIMASSDARIGISTMLEHGPGHRVHFAGA